MDTAATNFRIVSCWKWLWPQKIILGVPPINLYHMLTSGFANFSYSNHNRLPFNSRRASRRLSDLMINWLLWLLAEGFHPNNSMIPVLSVCIAFLRNFH